MTSAHLNQRLRPNLQPPPPSITASPYASIFEAKLTIHCLNLPEINRNLRNFAYLNALHTLKLNLQPSALCSRSPQNKSDTLLRQNKPVPQQNIIEYLQKRTLLHLKTETLLPAMRNKHQKPPKILKKRQTKNHHFHRELSLQTSFPPR